MHLTSLRSEDINVLCKRSVLQAGLLEQSRSAGDAPVSSHIQSKCHVLSQVKGPAFQFCWPFFVAFKEHALWTSLEKDAIMMTGEGTF